MEQVKRHKIIKNYLLKLDFVLKCSQSFKVILCTLLHQWRSLYVILVAWVTLVHFNRVEPCRATLKHASLGTSLGNLGNLVKHSGPLALTTRLYSFLTPFNSLIYSY